MVRDICDMDGVEVDAVQVDPVVGDVEMEAVVSYREAAEAAAQASAGVPGLAGCGVAVARRGSECARCCGADGCYTAARVSAGGLKRHAHSDEVRAATVKRLGLLSA